VGRNRQQDEEVLEPIGRGNAVPLRVVATGNRMKRYWSERGGERAPGRHPRRNRQQDEEVLEHGSPLRTLPELHGRNRQQDEEVLEHPYPDRRNHRSGCRNRQQDEEVLEPE